MNPIHKARTLADIRRVCRPTPLSGPEELDSFFVETDPARDRHQKTRRRLSNALDVEGPVRLLFYGHRGCGKSTELNKFLAEQGGRFLPVTFSVHQEMSPIAVRAEDLVLIIADRVLNAAKNEGLEVSEEILKPVLDFFVQVTRTEKESRDGNFEAGAGISSEDSVLGKLLGLFGKIRADIKLNVHGEETKVAVLRKRPADLLAQANAVIQAVEERLEGGRELLIVVEDLDKLDIQQARRIYIEQVSILTGIESKVIYTIPIFLFFSPDVNAFRHNFDDVVSLPMIKVVNPGGERTAGFETVKDVVCRRIDEGIIEPPALDLLVAKTGGVLRHVFQVLQSTAMMVDTDPPLSTDQIEYGLRQLQKEFWQQITLPYEPLPGGPESADELYERLSEYGREQEKGNRNPPRSDAINQILLKSCALVEYNGEGWFGIHPLVVENLKALGRL